MPSTFFLELPERSSGRRTTCAEPWVVEAETVSGRLRITWPRQLQLIYPGSDHWISVPGPARLLSEAEWIIALRTAGADAALVAAAVDALSPLERAILQAAAGGGS